VLPAAAQLMPASDPAMPAALINLLAWITPPALVLIGSAAVLLGLRTVLLRRRSVRRGETWGCGYLLPSARMQYTASSFAQPIIGMFATVLHPRQELHPPQGLLPTYARLSTHTTELFVRCVYGPALRALLRLAFFSRRIQQGRTHLYILFIVITILALLIWNLS